MDEFRALVSNKSNDELLKMVYEFTEWSPQMLAAVEQELSQRNMLPIDLAIRKNELIELENAELTAGKQASLLGQIAGWLTVLGLLGIAIGYHYAFSKVKSKYTGKIYFQYNENSRKNGSFIFFTSIVLAALFLLFKIAVG